MPSSFQALLAGLSGGKRSLDKTRNLQVFSQEQEANRVAQLQAIREKLGLENRTQSNRLQLEDLRARHRESLEETKARLKPAPVEKSKAPSATAEKREFLKQDAEALARHFGLEDRVDEIVAAKNIGGTTGEALLKSIDPRLVPDKPPSSGDVRDPKLLTPNFIQSRVDDFTDRFFEGLEFLPEVEGRSKKERLALAREMAEAEVYLNLPYDSLEAAQKKKVDEILKKANKEVEAQKAKLLGVQAVDNPELSGDPVFSGDPVELQTAEDFAKAVIEALESD
jgi:hypothetical protein